MRRFTTAVVFLGLAAGSSFAQDAPSPQAVEAAKEATVLVRARSTSTKQTAAGYVMRVAGGAVYIATTRAAVNVPIVEAKGATGPSLSVVFHSGTENEEIKPAAIVATDPARDLAVLRVQAPTIVPNALVSVDPVELVENSVVAVGGFPAGAESPLDAKGPAVVVSKGVLASVVRDGSGRVVSLQVEGLNQTNAGGPIVDRLGKLVGVALTPRVGEKSGSAAMIGRFSTLLEPRAGLITTRPKPSFKPGMIVVDVGVEMIDPLAQARFPAIHHALGGDLAAKPVPDADGAFKQIAETGKADLKPSDGWATASITIPAETGKVDLTLQVSFVDASGKVHYSAPSVQHLAVTLPPVKTAGPAATKGAMAKKKAAASDDEPTGGFGSSSKKKAATSDDAGIVRRGLAFKAPVPQATNQSLGGEPREVNDLKVVDVNVKTAKLPRCLCWSGDGKSFFVLEHDGLLRRIALEGMVETLRVDLGKSCAWLSRSASGLVVTLDDAQEVWLIDADTLQVKTRVAVAGVTRAVSSPELTVAFATDKGHNLASVIDLKLGKVVRQYSPEDFQSRVGFAKLEVTPNGKYLLTEGGTEQLQRFRIKGNTLTLDEVSERIAQNGRAIEVSPDGFYVALPSGGGNYGAGAYATNVYKINNFTKPELVVKAGAYPQALGFDIKTERILAQSHDSPLIVFLPSGVKSKEYKLAKKRNVRESAKQFLVHPDGGKCLVLTDAALYYVEFPAN